jgi:hypothetical protein
VASRLQLTFTLVYCSACFFDPEDGGDIFLRSLPLTFTLVSCSSCFFNPEDGGDMFLRSLPLTFTLVSCSAYFFDPEDGGDMLLRSLPPAFTLVSCSAYFFDPEDGGDMLSEACHLLSRWFLAQLIFSTLKMEAICSFETSVDNVLNGVISQKLVLFITTAVSTSKPAPCTLLLDTSQERQ